MKDRILHTMRLEGRVKESGDGGVFGRLPKGDKPPKTWVWKQSPQILQLLLPVVQFSAYTLMVGLFCAKNVCDGEGSNPGSRGPHADSCGESYGLVEIFALFH